MKREREGEERREGSGHFFNILLELFSSLLCTALHEGSQLDITYRPVLCSMFFFLQPCFFLFYYAATVDFFSPTKATILLFLFYYAATVDSNLFNT
jgi:hypothetical protein